MNYAEMKRVFKRGGLIDLSGHPTVTSLKEMLRVFPVGQRRNLRVSLKTAKSFVPAKKERGLL